MFPSSPQNIPTCWSIVVMINGDNWPMALSTSLDQSHRLSCWQDRQKTEHVAAASGKLFLTLSQYLCAFLPHLMQATAQVSPV